MGYRDAHSDSRRLSEVMKLRRSASVAALGDDPRSAANAAPSAQQSSRRQRSEAAKRALRGTGGALTAAAGEASARRISSAVRSRTRCASPGAEAPWIRAVNGPFSTGSRASVAGASAGEVMVGKRVEEAVVTRCVAARSQAEGAGAATLRSSVAGGTRTRKREVRRSSREETLLRLGSHTYEHGRGAAGMGVLLSWGWGWGRSLALHRGMGDTR